MIPPFVGGIAFLLRFPLPAKGGYRFTIYTHGAPESFLEKLKENKDVKLMLNKGVRIDNREIDEVEWVDDPRGKTTVDDEGKQVRLTFKDGQIGNTKFLLHHPKTQLSPLGRTVADEFGIELNPAGDIPAASFMQDTAVPGLYIAGDLSNQLKAVGAATYQGMLAGVAATRALAMEDLRAEVVQEGETEETDAVKEHQVELGALGASENGIVHQKEL
jgi:pyruvate/2-oxoglutarate dehydrogenase complex dihydrolipoamide dehydrogenase (E3) component